MLRCDHGFLAAKPLHLSINPSLFHLSRRVLAAPYRDHAALYTVQRSPLDWNLHSVARCSPYQTAPRSVDDAHVASFLRLPGSIHRFYTHGQCQSLFQLRPGILLIQIELTFPGDLCRP